MIRHLLTLTRLALAQRLCRHRLTSLDFVMAAGGCGAAPIIRCQACGARFEVCGKYGERRRRIG